MTLHHLTTTTGHVARTERADVADAVIALLKPIVEGGSGPIPGPEPLWLDVERHPAGWAEFHLASGPAMAGVSVAYGACVACWRATASGPALDRLERLARVLGSAVQRNHLPLPVPWLAVVLAPGIVTLSRESLGMLGDLERCVFWTLVGTDRLNEPAHGADAWQEEAKP